MFGSNVLDIGVGLVIVFMLVSTICTAVREGIEAWLKTRAAYLEHGIRQLLNDKGGTGLAKALYEHPLVDGIFSGSYTAGENVDKPAVLAKGNNLPSYIASKNFARALMDIAARGPGADTHEMDENAPVISLESIRQNVSKLQNPQIQRVMLHAIDSAQGDLNKMQSILENWYNSSMDRVSGWYKRSTQTIIFFIALATVVGLNINTVKIANYLAINESARAAVVAKAGVVAADTAQALTYDEAKTALSSLVLPIGWPDGLQSAAMSASSDKGGFWNFFLGPLLGWLITAFAAMLGAPFWFDMLNKIMVIRSTVKPHEKSREEGSEDRRDPQPQVVVVGQQQAQ